MLSRKRQNGFSLLELLFALSIVALLLSVSVVTTKHLRNRAYLTVFMTDIRRVKQAVTRYEGDCGFFPPDVWRGVDPGLVTEYGWQDGNHSSSWDELECDVWRGPYMREWPQNPWGGLYDYDNYPSSYSAWGIPGGGVYLTLKPSTWGGTDGMPPPIFERYIEEQGIDVSPQLGVVAVWLGREPTWGGSGQPD